MKRLLLLLFISAAGFCLAQTAPMVSNVTAAQRLDGSRIVDIWYDLWDADGDLCEIELKVSVNGGVSFDLNPSSGLLSGDIGPDVASGTGKHIVWNAGGEAFRLDGDQFRFKVSAEDEPSPGIPSNFILVEGGTFHNGTSNITLSSFYLDRYELTQAGYEQIMKENPSHDYGVGPSYPVYRVSWFDAIEYCNRRSIQEGITPCYSYGNYGADPDSWPTGWNANYQNQNFLNCNWSAPGYRLPSEMEWMFAAKGGNQSLNFIYSGSNDVDLVAWYNENSGGVAHIVGLKVPNELGFHDMSGNLWEWVWDFYFATYPTSDQTNPHGPDYGTCRVNRGSCFHGQGSFCAVTFRNIGGLATDIYYGVGFRVCRNAPQD
ncbi:MAG: formylglycine-generating enzyme family protein [Candidatus Syntrophosphaera sp.]|nr:formylglycine-generating enzyme family protein [Candidatus Syntrophosphaera sp.]